MAPRLDFSPFRTQYFFLCTTVLATLAWFLALIFQAIATAQFGRRAVGYLWFAILLQATLNLSVVLAVATDSITAMRAQIASFGSIAIVFAVLGTDAGLFEPLHLHSKPALAAMGTGYLLFALIDILWVIYFTSEADSLALHILSYLGASPPRGHRRARGPSPPTVGPPQLAPVAMAYNISKASFNLGPGVNSEDVEIQMTETKLPPPTTPAAAKRASTNSAKLRRPNTGSRRSIGSRKSLASSLKVDELPQLPAARASSPAGALPPPLPMTPTPSMGGMTAASITSPIRVLPSPSTRGMPMGLPSAPKGPPPPLNLANPVHGAGALGGSITALGPGATPLDLVQSATKTAVAREDEDEADDPLPRARALHAYTASPDDPDELSFRKGEILEIEDQEGKWWQAKREDGTTGIVPSNYLVLL